MKKYIIALGAICLALGTSAVAEESYTVVQKTKSGSRWVVEVDGSCSSDTRMDANGRWVPYARFSKRVCAETITYKAKKYGKNWKAKYVPIAGSEKSTYKMVEESRSYDEHLLRRSDDFLDDWLWKQRLMNECNKDRKLAAYEARDAREANGVSPCEKSSEDKE